MLGAIEVQRENIRRRQEGLREPYKHHLQLATEAKVKLTKLATEVKDLY